MAHPLGPPSNPPPPPPTDPPSKNPKRSSQNPKVSHLLHASTLRNPRWTYFHLAFVPTTPDPPGVGADLDPLTARTHLTTPLAQFLGTHGASISIDILKIEGREVWVRVPAEDGKIVGAGLAGWVGKSGAWRVVGRGSWLGGLVGQGGEGVFG